jgi:predicted phosphoribosyltransferase
MIQAAPGTAGDEMPRSRVSSLAVPFFDSLEAAMFFANRSDAGRQLARALQEYTHHPDALVLGLPRGGVPVAFEAAHELHLPLDVFIVRKLGMPGQEELAIGAIASGGIIVLNEDIVHYLQIDDATIHEIAKREAAELSRREQLYRGDRPLPDVHDKTVILIDDGLATGSSMRAAIAALRQMGPKRILVAVPVGAPETCEMLRQEADEVLCLETPEQFFAVGNWYADFSQISDEEVRELLSRAAMEHAGA